MKMKKIHGAMFALGALAMFIASSAPSHAQETGSFPDYYAFVGRDPGMGPKCPPMQYHVVAKNKTQLEGVAYTAGQDGMELYSVSGTLGSGGKVSMTLKPATGAGTPATVEGTYKLGMLMLKTASGSCHVDEFMMMPIVPPVRVGPPGGN